jgi:hypothetical protein
MFQIWLTRFKNETFLAKQMGSGTIVNISITICISYGYGVLCFGKAFRHTSCLLESYGK